MENIEIFIVAGLWILREIMAKIIHNRSEYSLLKKRNEKEFEYHRQKYIFETRSPIYIELYRFSKKVHGTGASLIELKNTGIDIRMENMEACFLEK